LFPAEVSDRRLDQLIKLARLDQTFVDAKYLVQRVPTFESRWRVRDWRSRHDVKLREARPRGTGDAQLG
jgi:hypothetical protein